MMAFFMRSENQTIEMAVQKYAIKLNGSPQNGSPHFQIVGSPLI